MNSISERHDVTNPALSRVRVTRYLWLPLLVLLVAVAGSSAAGASSPRGDANCSGVTDGRDALDMLLALDGEDVMLPQDCLTLGELTVAGLGGDVNCDGEFDVLDPLTSLKLSGRLSTHPCLAVTLSDFGKVSEEIGPDGGMLSTTALDGTVYTLDIPAGALLGPEWIAMTPVDSIDDFPIPGGLVAAVDLQPSGLTFWEAAILTIDPADDVPPADQTPFVISEGQFVLHPLVLDSGEIQLPLTHFSVAGVGEGPATDAEPPSSALGRYTAQAAGLVLAQRAALLGGGSGDPQFASELGGLMEAYYDAYVAPGLDTPSVSAAAFVECPVEIQVVGHALGFASQGQSLGGGSFPAIARAIQILSPSLAGCRERAFELCVQFHDVGAISRIVAYSRMMVMLGIEVTPSPLDEMIRKCARFEISFLSWFCVDDTTEMPVPCVGGISYVFITEDQPTFSMPLTPSHGPLASVHLKVHRGDWNEHFGCHGTMTSTGSDFRVLSGGFSMNPFLSGRPNGAPPITLVINPGIPPEELSLTCPWGTGTQPTTLWWQKWCSWHQNELTPGYADTAALCFNNEQPGGWGFALPRTGWLKTGDRRWDLDINRTYMEAGVFEIGWEGTKIILWHAPLP